MMIDAGTCGICGSTPGEHELLNHEFSASGQLIPKVAKPAPRPPLRINGADTVLRALLIGKGIITSDELKVTPEREEVHANEDPTKASAT